jgi:hypothetical protein
VIAPDDDIARDQVPDGGIASAKHHVLASRLEVIVLNDERTGSVPAANRLTVLAVVLDVADVRVPDDGGSAVQRDAAFLSMFGITANNQSIQFEVVGHRCRIVLRPAAVAQTDHVALAAGVGLKGQPLQPPVVCARPGCQCGAGVR